MTEKEYCITYNKKNGWLEEYYYYSYATSMEDALKDFRKSINQEEVTQIKEIRLLGDIDGR